MFEKMKRHKPDCEEVMRRYEAYWEGELTDRPLLIYQNNKKDFAFRNGTTYHDRCFGDMDKILDDFLYNLDGQNFYGDALPGFWISLGTHELASYMGSEIVWGDENSDTCWAKHREGEFEDLFPIRIDDQNPMYRRILEFYRKASEKLGGEAFVFTLDFHTNMDLLISLRGDAQLCLDTIDCPEKIDEAMPMIRGVFKKVFDDTAKAGQFEKYGYYYDTYSKKKHTTLACDFSALVGQETFRRWIMPTLEYEASLLDRVRFHWDGPAALRHFDDIMSVKKIHTISYVPNPSERHTQYLEMYQKIQKAGKGVEFGGTADEIREASKVLLPEKTIYRLQGDYSEKEFEELEKYLRRK